MTVREEMRAAGHTDADVDRVELTTTYTYVDEPMVLAAVTNALALRAALSMDEIVRRILGIRNQTWEERLAAAIEERSIRNRLRRIPQRLYWLRFDWSERIRLAIRVLRGDHECYW